MSRLPAQPHDATGLTAGDRLQRQLRLVTLAWVFGSVWLWTVSGATMTQFARSLGTPDWGFGILAMLPFIGTFIQLPAGYLLERYGHRKAVFMVTATAGRLLWAVAAGVPWMLPRTVSVGEASVNLWWPSMAGLLALSWILMSASGPAWMNWMSDLIPRRVRGRYFATRNNVGNCIGLVATVAIGYALDVTERAGGVAEDIAAGISGGGGGHDPLMLRVTSALLAVAGLMGALDILCFRGVVDLERPREHKPITMADMIRGPLRDANFRSYLAFVFVFNFGTAYIGQYVWLYMLDVLEWTNKQANLLIVAIPLAMRLFCYGPWGRLTDRLGKKPVILISGFFTIFGAAGWLLCTAENWWVGYLLVLCVVVAWPGFEIATFNFILDLSGSRRRGVAEGASGGASGGAYVAMNSLTVAVAGGLSGLFASVIAAWLRDWTWATGVMGIVLTYHGVLFIISTVLRAAAVLIAMTLREEHATRTRDAIRIMAGGFYSNVQRATVMPVELAGRAMRWTYRLHDADKPQRP
mgnify:CR=1 FL=1